jgi:hypothetical protein
MGRWMLQFKQKIQKELRVRRTGDGNQVEKWSLYVSFSKRGSYYFSRYVLFENISK